MGLKPKQYLTWLKVLLLERGNYGVFQLLMLGFKLRRNKKLWRNRLRECVRCPLYDRRYKTCGSPGTDVGCHCFLPMKAALPEARCWVEETLLEDDQWGKKG